MIRHRFVNNGTLKIFWILFKVEMSGEKQAPSEGEDGLW